MYNYDQGVTALNSQNGNANWNVKSCGPPYIGENDNVYIPYRGGIYKVNTINNGTYSIIEFPKKERVHIIGVKSENPKNSTPKEFILAKVGAYIYTINLHTKATVHKFPQTGKVTKSQKYKNTLYVSDRYHKFTAINSSNGNIQWTFEAKKDFLINTPVEDKDGILYII